MRSVAGRAVLFAAAFCVAFAIKRIGGAMMKSQGVAWRTWMRERKRMIRAGRGTVGKTAVLGMRERGGRTKAMPVNSVDAVAGKRLTYERLTA